MSWWATRAVPEIGDLDFRLADGCSPEEGARRMLGISADQLREIDGASVEPAHGSPLSQLFEPLGCAIGLSAKVTLLTSLSAFDANSRAGEDLFAVLAERINAIATGPVLLILTDHPGHSIWSAAIETMRDAVGTAPRIIFAPLSQVAGSAEIELDQGPVPAAEPAEGWSLIAPGLAERDGAARMLFCPLGADPADSALAEILQASLGDSSGDPRHRELWLHRFNQVVGLLRATANVGDDHRASHTQAARHLSLAEARVRSLEQQLEDARRNLVEAEDEAIQTSIRAHAADQARQTLAEELDAELHTVVELPMVKQVRVTDIGGSMHAEVALARAAVDVGDGDLIEAEPRIRIPLRSDQLPEVASHPLCGLAPDDGYSRIDWASSELPLAERLGSGQLRQAVSIAAGRLLRCECPEAATLGYPSCDRGAAGWIL